MLFPGDAHQGVLGVGAEAKCGARLTTDRALKLPRAVRNGTGRSIGGRNLRYPQTQGPEAETLGEERIVRSGR